MQNKITLSEKEKLNVFSQFERKSHFNSKKINLCQMSSNSEKLEESNILYQHET